MLKKRHRLISQRPDNGCIHCLRIYALRTARRAKGSNRLIQSAGRRYHGNWIQSVHQQTEELVSQQLNTTKEQAKEMSKLLLHETDRLLEQRITDAVKDFEGKLYGINDNAMNAVELRIKETRNTAILNLTTALIVLLAVIILAFKFTF